MTTAIKLGLLGNGIGRSRAKSLHELLGRECELVLSYLPMDLANTKAPVDIAVEIQRCRDEGFRGINITHPYKREAFHHAITGVGVPKGLTSVNTVLLNENANHAYNTDYSGFCRGYQKQFGEQSPAGKVLMIGTGGVGLAIAFGLIRQGASELVLHDNNQSAAESLLAQLQKTRLPVRLARTDLIEEMRAADGLVNATPLGMFQYPGSAFPSEGFADQRWAFDAVYTPENTEFLQKCRQRGIETLSGFKLFLYQGLDAFELFTGLSVDDKAIESLFLNKYPLE